jgi:hypothetical protein
VDLVARLVHRLAVLPEPAMREAVLVEELAALPPADSVAALASLAELATRERNPSVLILISALAGALERLPYSLRRDLYEAAKAAGLLTIAQTFFAAPPTPQPPVPAPEQVVPGTGRSITLGERKTLARGGRRDLVAALLRDPDASVIANLLENPRLCERDVLAVAARRPVRGEVLRRIFTSRWCARYHVKRALVLNPYTPGDIALRLVLALTPADLRLVADDAQLAEPVRAQARGALGGLRASSARPSPPD